MALGSIPTRMWDADKLLKARNARDRVLKLRLSVFTLYLGSSRTSIYRDTRRHN